MRLERDDSYHPEIMGRIGHYQDREIVTTFKVRRHFLNFSYYTIEGETVFDNNGIDINVWTTAITESNESLEAIENDERPSD